MLFIANLVLVIWALVDAIDVPDDPMFRAGNKLTWVIVIVFAGFIGAILYFAVGRPSSAGGVAAPPSFVDPNDPPPPPPGAIG